MTDRARLPNRRPSINVQVMLDGHGYTVTFNEDDPPREVFVDGGKDGSRLAAEMHDGAVAASLALQYGCPLDVLAGAMLRGAAGEAQSVLALACDVARGGP